MQTTELDVWKSSMDLTQTIYELADEFPEDDRHDLKSLFRETCVQVPSYIASAASKKYGKDSLRFLYEAKTQIYKIETQLYLAERLNYISEEKLNELLEQLDVSRRLLFGFIKHYKRSAR